MAKTLGQQLDDVQNAISKVLSAQSYQTGDKEVSRAALFRLEEREEKLLSKISIYGRNYTEGQNTEPTGDTAYASF